MPPKVDIWMPLYIGDYLGDTAHLDAERSGAYLHLLMHYWKRGPLPDDIPAIITIARLKGSDAPSIAQALLKEFFTKNGDGYWHQKRQDIEIAKWQDKSLKAQEKAKTAAEARWGKDAPSIPPSIAPSTPQALHTLCPSPSPSPSPLSLTPPEPPEEKPKKQKTSAKSDIAKVDSRFTLFRQDFEAVFQKTNHVPAPWDGKEADNLSRWLKKNPTISRAQWEHILKNRFLSPVNQSAELSKWLGNAISWLNNLADEWGKPLKQNGGNTNAEILNGKGGHNMVVSDNFDREKEYSQRTLPDGYIQGN
jgi:uncharacterized protein YdaU (DUF1376 family)